MRLTTRDSEHGGEGRLQARTCGKLLSRPKLSQVIRQTIPPLYRDGCQQLLLVGEVTVGSPARDPGTSAHGPQGHGVDATLIQEFGGGLQQRATRRCRRFDSSDHPPILFDNVIRGAIVTRMTLSHESSQHAVVSGASTGMGRATAPVETLPLEVSRRVFEVNVFGQIALTQALLPALHRSGGRVVDISSTGGRIAMPAYGAYSGSKFAIEAISDAMRQELAPQGVQVVIVEPGGVRTAMGDRGSAVARDLHSQMTVEQHDRYDRLMAAFLSHSATFASEGVSAEEAAKVIARAATDRRPRTRYTIGRDAALLTRLARILPDRMMDRAIARTLRPHYPKA